MAQVTEPFPIFHDDDGLPLEGGMIYIGVANQEARTNPITVYTDRARTIPIAQPIRTIGGRPSYQGAPVNLYVAPSSFSITVQTKLGALVVNTTHVVESIEDFSFIQSGTDAATRDAQSKLRDTVAPEDFGALSLEDGASVTASQTTAIRNALQSGKIVDCNGKTYTIGGAVDPTDSTVAGLVNGKFIRAAANQSAQNYMFNLTNQPGILIEGNEFDLGTTEDTGTDNDSSRGAIAVGSNDEDSATWLSGVKVLRNRFTGDGNGTAIFARGLVNYVIENNLVVDRVTESATATNDNQNGIDVSWGRGGIVRGNFVDGLWKRESGVLVRRFSRGILVTEQSGTIVSGNFVRNVDQGIDLSGGITVDLPDGNVGCNVVGNVVTDVRTWGIKFANVARDCYCGGNLVRNFGWAGIIASSPSSAPSNPAKATSYITIEGNYVYDPSDYDSRANCIGIWILPNASGFTGYPVGCIVRGNTVRASAGNTRLLHGYALTDGDYNIVSGGPYNKFIDNTVSGQTGAPSKGCTPDGVCVLTANASQAINNTTWTSIEWNVETVDGEGMHNNSSNLELITAVVSGWYIVTASVAFAANATGVRGIRFRKNGGAVPGGDAMIAASSDANAHNAVSLTCIMHLAATDNVRAEAYQSSGGALNVLRENSQFSVRRIEQMGGT